MPCGYTLNPNQSTPTSADDSILSTYKQILTANMAYTDPKKYFSDSHGKNQDQVSAEFSEHMQVAYANALRQIDISEDQTLTAEEAEEYHAQFDSSSCRKTVNTDTSYIGLPKSALPADFAEELWETYLEASALLEAVTAEKWVRTSRKVEKQETEDTVLHIDYQNSTVTQIKVSRRVANIAKRRRQESKCGYTPQSHNVQSPPVQAVLEPKSSQGKTSKSEYQWQIVNTVRRKAKQDLQQLKIKETQLNFKHPTFLSCTRALYQNHNEEEQMCEEVFEQTREKQANQVIGAVQASASLKEAASIHFNTIDHNEILRRAEWKATEVGQEWSVAQHTINAKAPNVYSAAITRSNAKIVAAKNNDNQEESGNREGSSQQTTNEQETKGRRGDEDQGEHPSSEGGSSRKRKSRKEKRTSEGKLNAMTECIHTYRGYENKMNEGSFFSIITINLRGLKGLRNGAKVANFCSQVLRYKEKYSATVICLQDLMIEEGSWTYAAINSHLANRGFKFMLRSFTEQDTKVKGDQKIKGRGVAMILPSVMLVPNTARPASASVNSSTAYGYSLSVVMQIGPSAKIHVISTLAPPGSENTEVRKALHEQLDKDVNWCQTHHPNIGTFVAGDLNSVADPEMDTLYGSHNAFPSPTVPFLQGDLAMIDLFREKHPDHVAFSRIQSKRKADRIEYEAARIDYICATQQALINNSLLQVVIDHDSGFYSDHSPVIATFTLNTEEVASVHLDPKDEVRPPWSKFIESSRECDQHILRAKSNKSRELLERSHPKHDLSEKLAQHECTLAAIQERVEAVKRQCESANTAKMAQRTEMDNIAIHINNTIVDIANSLTKKNSNNSDQSKPEKNDKLTNKKINAIKHRSAKALQLPKYQAHPFKEAMKTRADIQLLLSEAEGLLTVIRRTSTNVCNHTDQTIKGKPIQMSQKVKLESRSKTTTVIHSYNQTVDKIVSKLQKLQSQVEDDIQEERQVLQSSEKIANKHYAQQDLQKKLMEEWVGTLVQHGLTKIPLPHQKKQLREVAKEALAEARSRESKRRPKLGPDKHEETCYHCKSRNDPEKTTMVKCDGCTRVYHPESCCDGVIGDGKVWWCPTCQLLELAAETIEKHLEEDENDQMNEGQFNTEDQWKEWQSVMITALQMLKHAIVKHDQTIRRFATQHQRSSRLLLFCKGKTAPWYRMINQKDREPLNPITRYRSSGLFILTKEGRLQETANFHQDFCKEQGTTIVSMQEYTDEAGRRRFKWIEDEQQFKQKLREETDKVRNKQGEAEAEAFREAQEALRTKWYPKFCKKDWTKNEQGQENPTGMPTQKLTEEEWQSILAGPHNKERMDSFCIPAVKWMGPRMQKITRDIIEIMLCFNITPYIFKNFLRIAIEKAVPGTYRHIAAATDWYAVVATLRYQRLLPSLVQIFPPQIVAYLKGRSAMDANIQKQSVREDAEQAVKEGWSNGMCGLAIDIEKFFDSLWLDAVQWALLAFDAPDEVQEMIAEDFKDNHFQVKTNEGLTRNTAMEGGTRQGNTVSCFTSNLVNALYAEIIKKEGVSYQLEFNHPTRPVSRAEMGAAYCDDQEQYLEGVQAKQRTGKVMGQVSIVERKGIHPDKSLSFFNMKESEIQGHELQFYAWSREENGIKLITIKRADHIDPKTGELMEEGTVIGSSLGAMVVKGSDNRRAQNAKNRGRIMRQVQKMQKASGLTKCEAAAALYAMLSGAGCYDVEGCPSDDKTIRWLAQWHRSLLRKSYGFTISDRSGYMFAPTEVAGEGLKHMFGETIAGKIRENRFYMHHETMVAARMRQSRWYAALGLIQRNMVRDKEQQVIMTTAAEESAKWLATNGIYWRDMYQPVTARILGQMVHDAGQKANTVYNWTSAKTPPDQYIQRATRFCHFGEISVAMHQVIAEETDCEKVVQIVTEACADPENSLTKALTKAEISRLPSQVRIAFAQIHEEWHNMTSFQVKYADKMTDGTTTWSDEMTISAEVPKDLIMHGPKGRDNISKAAIQQAKQLRTDSNGLPIIEQCNAWTDGSEDKELGHIGWSAVFCTTDEEIMQSHPKMIISQRMCSSVGTSKTTNNIAETAAVTKVLELVQFRRQFIIFTDSKVAQEVIIPRQMHTARIAAKSAFLSYAQRAKIATDRNLEMLQNRPMKIEQEFGVRTQQVLESLDAADKRADEITQAVAWMIELDGSDCVIASINGRYMIYVPSHQDDNKNGQQSEWDPCRALVEPNIIADTEAKQAAAKDDPGHMCTDVATNHFAVYFGKEAIIGSTDAFVRIVSQHMAESKLASKVVRITEPILAEREEEMTHSEDPNFAAHGTGGSTAVGDRRQQRMHQMTARNREHPQRTAKMAADIGIVQCTAVLAQDSANEQGHRKRVKGRDLKKRKTQKAHTDSNGKDGQTSSRGINASKQIDKEAVASGANQNSSGPNQSRSPIRKKRHERHCTDQSNKQAADCSKPTSTKKKVSETTEDEETHFKAVPDSQERIPISTTINFEDSTKDSTYQGQTARALRRDPAFNMSKPISASQQKLMWYIAMFQTRTMRMDDGLKMAFQWTLHKQVQARRAQGLPEVKLKSGEHPFQNNHETCCLCYSTHPTEQARGNQWHALMDCPATRGMLYEVLTVIEHKMVRMRIMGYVSDWEVWNPDTTNWTTDDNFNQFKILQRIKWLVPCKMLGEERMSDNDKTTYALGYMGLICMKIANHVRSQNPEKHSTKDVNEMLESLRTMLVDQVISYANSVQLLLSKKYKSIREDFEASGEDMSEIREQGRKQSKRDEENVKQSSKEQVDQDVTCKSSNTDRRRREHNKAKDTDTDNEESIRKCTAIYCQQKAKRQVPTGTYISGEATMCSNCTSLEWIQDTVMAIANASLMSNKFLKKVMGYMQVKTIRESERAVIQENLTVRQPPHQGCWIELEDILKGMLRRACTEDNLAPKCECCKTRKWIREQDGRAMCNKCQGIIEIDQQEISTTPDSTKCTRCKYEVEDCHKFRASKQKTKQGDYRCRRCAVLTKMVNIISSPKNIHELIFDIDVRVTQVLERPLIETELQWQTMRKAVQNCQQEDSTVMWRSIVRATNRNATIAVNEDFGKQWGRKCLGYGADIPVSWYSMCHLERDQGVSNSVVNNFIQIIASGPSFLGPIRDAVTFASTCCEEFTKVRKNYTEGRVFKVTGDPEFGLTTGASVIVPIHFPEHWTLLIIDPELQVKIFFDPFHLLEPKYIEGYEQKIEQFSDYLQSITEKNDRAKQHFEGVKEWDVIEAHTQLIHKCPFQKIGGQHKNGCAMHCIAFAMDWLTNVDGSARTHEPLTDTEAFEMRRWVKFVLSTATAERLKVATQWEHF